MAESARPRAALHTRYPLSNLLVYNGATILHFALGGAGILLAYDHSWAGYLAGVLYLVLSFAEMYLVIPLAVCLHCVYYRLKGSLCISGLNLVSRSIAREGSAKDFPRRAVGLFCPNNLYLASLVIPILAVLPPLVLGFRLDLLVILLGLVGLLLFRFFVVFPRIACLHCSAKLQCPQAGAMGLRDR